MKKKLTSKQKKLLAELKSERESDGKNINFCLCFKNEYLITMDIVSESIKGRKAQITVQDIPISKYKALLLEVIETKGITI